jgi:uncharacterized protein (DUF1800 family)
MKIHRPTTLAILLLGLCVAQQLSAGEPNPPPPAFTGSTVVSNVQRQITWTPYPAAEQFKILTTTNLMSPYTEDFSGKISGYTWSKPLSNGAAFHKLMVMPMSSNDLFAATVLNRLTFGPTPDDIDRIKAIGPQAFINEQMNFGAVPETIDTDAPITNVPPAAPPLTNWIRTSVTGTAAGANFGIYLTGAGQVYVDNIVLVTGTVAEAGVNLIKNGDFEDPVLTNGWSVASGFARSVITNSPTVDGQAASGSNCLLIVCTSGTTAITSGIWQPFATNSPPVSQKFTLSFSYLPVQNQGTNTLVARLSGTAATSSNILPSAPPTPPAPPAPVSPVYAELTNTVGSLEDIRAWTVLHAVQSKRQLYEVMVQFVENHFSTQYQKTKDWFDGIANVVTNDTVRQYLAVDMEFREHMKWRQLLLDPNCNFQDLLKVSIESPAMIIYLDTILSTKSAANENYAREIMELHGLGADNGYVQQDIVELAKVWTGWSVAKKDFSVANDPFAAPLADPTNSPGAWVLHFKTNSHNYNIKRLFTNNVIDARFGPEFRGGQAYSLIITNLQYPGTNGMQEGYKFIQHMAELPYCAEFLSVKLCRLFVHENFDFGVYDYRDPNLSPEGKLVKDCMTAWFTAGPDGRHGNIRSVLNVIFNSKLFRGHGASQQKVKTPLEFVVSAVRALRVGTTNGSGHISVTADTDGYGISGLNNTSPLSRMGGMGLFNKTEPDGYSEMGKVWLNTANLCERMRFVQHLLMPTASGTKATDYGTPGKKNVSDPVALLKLKVPPASWTNPGVIVDYFLGVLYPGEGKANLDMDRQAALDFLNSDENGNSSLFASQNPTSAAYDGRVRGMVALLMCFPRYQEQ